jgi:hypothetical protein
VGVFVLVSGVDTWLILKKKPTMSKTMGVALKHPASSAIVAGAWLGLTYHLLIGERL